MRGRLLLRTVTATVVIAAGAWAANLAIAATGLPVAQPIRATSAYRMSSDTVRVGGSLSELFARNNLGGLELVQILAAADQLEPRHVRPGLAFSFRQPWDADTPDRVDSRIDADRILHLVRDSSGWTATVEPIPWAVQQERVEGVVHTSLDATLQDALPDSVLPPAERSRFVWDIADGVFAWQIDFTRDLREGDHFSLVFERTVSALGDVRYGRLVAARIETAGTVNTAYVLTDEAGNNVYYDADGRSLRRAFKRSPVAYRRISSGFTLGRYHPILHITRAHLGVDFVAPYGAEIDATGDGVIRFAGRDGGYGIMVAIRHPKGIETRYAHMSRIARGIRPGVHVQQGDAIGFVGQTGLATGPHVHYEFIKNGHAINPRSADLGDGTPLPAARRAEFAGVLARDDSLLLVTPPRPTVAASGN